MIQHLRQLKPNWLDEHNRTRLAVIEAVREARKQLVLKKSGGRKVKAEASVSADLLKPKKQRKASTRGKKADASVESYINTLTKEQLDMFIQKAGGKSASL